jgi:hypothetical protein
LPKFICLDRSAPNHNFENLNCMRVRNLLFGPIQTLNQSRLSNILRRSEILVLCLSLSYSDSIVVFNISILIRTFSSRKCNVTWVRLHLCKECPFLVYVMHIVMHGVSLSLSLSLSLSHSLSPTLSLYVCRCLKTHLFNCVTLHLRHAR